MRCVYTAFSLSLSLSLSELLVQALFKPGSTVNPDHKEKYLYLLAYATSVYESASGSDDPIVIKDDLLPTQEAIETACMICSAANDSYTELLTRIGKLFECLRYSEREGRDTC